VVGKHLRAKNGGRIALSSGKRLTRSRFQAAVSRTLLAILLTAGQLFTFERLEAA